MTRAREYLAGVWSVSALSLFAIVIVQTIFGKYGDMASQAWEWLLPTVLPTLTLVLGVMAATALHVSETQKQVRGTFFFLTLGISIFYLLAVAAVLLLEPFSTASPLDLMRVSSLWLGPLQGVTSAALGVFFIAAKGGSTE